ncbi:Beta-1,2-xylosyltransferase 1 [Fulvia fulva]|uniref:Beta-1,2-xylosyltransferase 1 n=1 Tax=Passalora fulva TaxID=5499 RepID=A0A9Q8PAL2_PASFU|nr:Beta-1,2-xylosyltransferase 1 [Fulvia fulva]UJO18963.1 Beta-1,2-xylosyltransferase 1 [Fulvia fulva]WPV16358.1 Beta-1,2-xylosyltransferase 1 [Fulvia fulva]WPV31030.1 Beta-1,2-xylosyltransferase 1 [Fulvia fulva]
MAQETDASDERDKARLLEGAGDDEFELDDFEEEEAIKQEQEHETRPRWQTHQTTSWHAITAKLSKRMVVIACVCIVLVAGLVWVHLPSRVSIDPAIMSHAIDNLIKDANATFTAMIAEGNPATVAEAAVAYRARRGRHPPPHFDKWFAWAQEHECTHIESMFDQVYEDIEPFWGVDGARVRADAASWPLILSVRDGEIDRRRVLAPEWGSRDLAWADMLKQIPSDGLPDVDMPLNNDDKAHIFVPWEDVNRYMEAAVKTKQLRSAEDMSQDYSSYPAPDEPSFDVFPDYPSEENMWRLVRDTCHPASRARTLEQDSDFTTPAENPKHIGAHMSSGFVANWTASKSACEVPDIRNVHGFFINSFPSSHMHWKRPGDDDRLLTRHFFPMFSSGKLHGSNNDIVIPPATSWGETYFSEDETLWEKKDDKVFWRGTATGGKNDRTNWTRFHRHRFISMTNGTQVAMTEQNPNPPAHVPGGDPPLPYNIPLPDPQMYPIAATTAERPSKLSSWISSWAATAFVDLSCDEQVENVTIEALSKVCPYNYEWYTSVDRTPMEYMYRHKYLPDIDGHGYSGRFRSLMDSDSVPLKATIWAEWSTSRLYAWKHFVPMDNTFMDLYGLVEYFLGYHPTAEGKAEAVRGGHDKEAKAIADAGREWASKVSRKDDMVLYLWRVVLEYARAVDDRREELGYVQDILDDSGV